MIQTKAPGSDQCLLQKLNPLLMVKNIRTRKGEEKKVIGLMLRVFDDGFGLVGIFVHVQQLCVIMVLMLSQAAASFVSLRSSF